MKNKKFYRVMLPLLPRALKKHVTVCSNGFLKVLILLNTIKGIVYQVICSSEILLGLTIQSGKKLSDIKKYYISPLNIELKAHYLNKLESFVKINKPYLEPDINLTTLAEKTSIPSRYLSQVLNECMKMNFYDYINNYRIHYSKQLLSNSANAEKSLTDIAFETGFISKSVFISVFKKITNQTPSEYRLLKIQKLDNYKSKIILIDA